MMLDVLGFTKPLPKPGKPVLKHQTSFNEECNSQEDARSVLVRQSHSVDEVNNNNTTDQNNGKQRRVTFNLREAVSSSSAGGHHSKDSPISNNGSSTASAKIGRQIAPGLLFISGNQINSS